MSLIQKIRDKSALLIFILIVLSLIAFILQDAFVGKTGNFFNQDASKIGMLGKHKILKEEFDASYDKTIQNYKQQQIPISEDLRYMVLENTWDKTIYAKTVSLEGSLVGLEISQKEFDEIFFGKNVHQYIKQQFTDPKTGTYNEETVKSYLLQVKKMKIDNPDKISFLNFFVKPILDEELKNKLIPLFTNAVYFPSWMKNTKQEQQALRSKINAIQIPYSSITDSNKLDNDDASIKKYVKAKHPELILKEKNISIAFVNFDIIPSASDSASSLEKMNTIKANLKKSKDLKKAFVLNGALKEYINTYTHLKDFSELDKKIITNLQANSIQGTIFSEGKFKLYALINKREMPDSVTCRHILIGTNSNIKRTDSAAKILADSMMVYIKKGIPFESLVNTYTDDEGSKSTKGVYHFSYNQYGGLVKEFADMIFFGKTGDKKIVKTSFGYHYIEIVKQQKPEMSYQIGIIAKDIEASKITIDSINQLALNFISKVNNAEQFLSQARKEYLLVNRANVFQKDYQSNAGYIRPIIRWAFENKENAVSNIVSIQNKMYVATILKAYKEGDVITNNLAYNIQNAIVNEAKANIILKTNEALKNKTLEGIAQSNNVVIHTIDSLQLSKAMIAIYGYEPKFVAATFNKNNKNKLESIKGSTGVYYFNVSDIYSVNSTLPAEILEKKYQDQINIEVINLMKKQYKIEDLRYNFY